MSHRSTNWPLDSQTLGKHRVLEQYLKAWMPILASRGGPCLFIDGFAGPGRYKDGEEGSPVIAMRVLKDHSAASRMVGPLRLFFIESRPDRFNALSTEVAALRATMPRCAEITAMEGHFTATVGDALDRLDRDRAVAAPMFVMADPFGIDGAPMSLFKRLLAHRGCELFITVMASFVHRFAATQEFEEPLDELYGTRDWRQIVADVALDNRLDALLSLYEAQLRANGAKFVLRFDLYRGNAYVYSIFFTTNNSLGCEKMKDAIWDVMPDGNFEYRDRDASQISLGVNGIQFGELERQLLAILPKDQWWPMSAVDDWGRSDRTMFRRAHLRTALKALEKRAAILVDRGDGNRFKRFSEHVLVRRASG